MRPPATEYPALVGEYFARAPQPFTGRYRGRAGSITAGALVEVRVDVADGRLGAPAFRAFGCPHIIAACSLLAERLDGQPVESLVDQALPELWHELEVPAEKAGKMLILQDALRALHDDCSREGSGSAAAQATKD